MSVITSLEIEIESEVELVQNELVKWLEKNQMKVEIADLLQSLNIRTLQDLKSADQSLIEERIMAQLKPIPVKKFHDCWASLRENIPLPVMEEIYSPMKATPTFSETNPLPLSVSEAKGSLPVSVAESKPTVKTALNMAANPRAFGVKKAGEDLSSLSVEELQRELKKETDKVEELQRRKARHEDRLHKIQSLLRAKSSPGLLYPATKLVAEKKVEKTPSNPWTCTMCKRENKEEDEKCLDCFTARNPIPITIPSPHKKATSYRCQNCFFVNRFRAPCRMCKGTDYEPIYEGDTKPRKIFFKPRATIAAVNRPAPAASVIPETKKERPSGGYFSAEE